MFSSILVPRITDGFMSGIFDDVDTLAGLGTKISIGS